MGVISVAYFVDAVRDFLKAKWKWLAAVMLALLVLTVYILQSVYILQLSLSIPNSVKDLLRPLNESIASGNWKTLCCTLNAISNCIPEHRPILIVCDFDNFLEDSLESLFKALEPMKQEQLSFPIILETSDFLWVHQRSFRKSSDSFLPYRLREMTFEDGRHELVDKYKMWKPEEYDKIYKEIGGHTGS